MSKLIEKIEAHMTGRRFYAELKNVAYSDLLEVNTEALNPIPHLVEYRIEARLGALVRWEQGQPTEKPLRQVCRAIENEVFGEFRKDIDKIHHALFDRDFEKATEALEDMHKRMFSV